MSKFTKDILYLSELASCIAVENFNELDILFEKLKKNKVKPIKIYETILQSYLFCGFPAAIESLKVFTKHFSDFVKSKSNYNISKFRKIGERNCKLIYKNNYKKLIENMNNYSPDLKEWIIVEGYGKVFGRKGLSLIEREFVNVAILCTKCYGNQLHSHIRGILYLGATSELIRETLIKIKDFTGVKNMNFGLKLLNKINQKIPK